MKRNLKKVLQLFVVVIMMFACLGVTTTYSVHAKGNPRVFRRFNINQIWGDGSRPEPTPAPEPTPEPEPIHFQSKLVIDAYKIDLGDHIQANIAFCLKGDTSLDKKQIFKQLEFTRKSDGEYNYYEADVEFTEFVPDETIRIAYCGSEYVLIDVGYCYDINLSSELNYDKETNAIHIPLSARFYHNIRYMRDLYENIGVPDGYEFKVSGKNLREDMMFDSLFTLSPGDYECVHYVYRGEGNQNTFHLNVSDDYNFSITDQNGNSVLLDPQNQPVYSYNVLGTEYSKPTVIIPDEINSTDFTCEIDENKNQVIEKPGYYCPNVFVDLVNGTVTMKVDANIPYGSFTSFNFREGGTEHRFGATLKSGIKEVPAEFNIVSVVPAGENSLEDKFTMILDPLIEDGPNTRMLCIYQKDCICNDELNSTSMAFTDNKINLSYFVTFKVDDDCLYDQIKDDNWMPYKTVYYEPDKKFVVNTKWEGSAAKDVIFKNNEEVEDFILNTYSLTKFKLNEHLKTPAEKLDIKEHLKDIELNANGRDFKFTLDDKDVIGHDDVLSSYVITQNLPKKYSDKFETENKELKISPKYSIVSDVEFVNKSMNTQDPDPKPSPQINPTPDPDPAPDPTPLVDPSPLEKLTFDLGDATVDGKHEIIMYVHYGDIVRLPGAPVKEGYKFLYWKGSRYEANALYRVTGDHKFTAIFEKVDEQQECTKSQKVEGQQECAKPQKVEKIPDSGDHTNTLFWGITVLAMLAIAGASKQLLKNSK